MPKPRKSAIVTGGASGMGLDIARALARRGDGVAVWDIDGEGARRTADEIEANGGNAFACGVDVANSASVDDAALRSATTLGDITVLVNCAGIGPFMPMTNHTEEMYDRIVDTNLRGPFNCIRAVSPGMVKANWGRIVNISSLAGQMGAAQMTAYSAAKAGLFGLTKSVAREFGRHCVTCNCLAPSAIDTPMLQEYFASRHMRLDEMKAATMVGRIGTVEDITAACLYFISEEAGFVTGQILSVNGGQYV